MNMINTGFYCPLRTEYGQQYPCQKGTYNNETASHNSSSCQICLAGSYCDVEGLTSSGEECEAGFYCEGLKHFNFCCEFFLNFFIIFSWINHKQWVRTMSNWLLLSCGV